MASRWRLGIGPLFALCCAAAPAGTAITVSDAWVREAPPGAAANAGYFTLHNGDGIAHTLTGVKSPQFAHAEIHATRIDGNRVRMRRVEEVEVPAHGSVMFMSGGDHLMLMQARHTLRSGARVELILQFKDAAALTVQAPVRRGEESDSAGNGMHDHMDGM